MITQVPFELRSTGHLGLSLPYCMYTLIFFKLCSASWVGAPAMVSRGKAYSDALYRVSFIVCMQTPLKCPRQLSDLSHKPAYKRWIPSRNTYVSRYMYLRRIWEFSFHSSFSDLGSYAVLYLGGIVRLHRCGKQGRIPRDEDKPHFWYSAEKRSIEIQSGNTRGMGSWGCPDYTVAPRPLTFIRWF